MPPAEKATNIQDDPPPEGGDEGTAANEDEEAWPLPEENDDEDEFHAQGATSSTRPPKTVGRRGTVYAKGRCRKPRRSKEI